MKYRIAINMDNAAFAPPAGYELARILRDLANRVDHAYQIAESQPLYDINGNHVGQAEMIAD
jgi:hypothetical protein